MMTVQQFQSIVQQAADGILVVDADGVVLFANPASAVLLGRAAAELTGTSLGQPIVVDGSTEMGILCKNGELVTVEMRAAEILWDGAPAVLATLRDISERVRASAQIEHLNSVLRAIRNINLVIVREKDPARLIQQACEALIETRGYAGARIAVGDGIAPPTNFAQAGWGERFEPLAASLRKGKWPACWKECVASKDVITIRDPKVACEGCPLSNAYGDRITLVTAMRHGGKVLGQIGVSIAGGLPPDEEEHSLLAAIAADVALALHTIEAERLQRESEARFKVITVSSPDAIFLTDRMGNYTYVNEAAAELLGWSTDELSKRNIADLAPKERVQDFLQIFHELLVKGRLFVELDLVRKNGTVVPVDLNAVLLPTGEVYASCRDLTARKQTEEALRRSEAQLKLAQQVAHIGHWELDACDGTPVWSDEIYRIFGLEPGTAAPSFTRHDTIVHPEEWPVLDEAVRAGFENGESFDLVFRILRPNQQLGWMHAIGSATRDDQGRVVKMFGTAQDITEQKQIELMRREAEELFQLSFEHASVGKSLTFPDGTLMQVNPALCDLLGYTREELQAKELAEVIHADDLALSAESGRRLLAGEQRHYRMEKRYLRKDGRTVWADVSTILLRRDDGSPRCFVTHVLDISERKEAVEALRESQQLLKGILDSIPARVFWKDRNLDYLGCNSAFARDAGFASPQDLIGKDDYQMGWRDQAESYRSDDREVIEQGVTRLLYEEPQTTPAGSTITLLTSKLPLRDAAGGITGVLGTYMDITELKELQAKLAQADRLSSMGMLAAGVAHEINNPLSYILYNLESLTEDLPELLAAIRQTQTRLGELSRSDDLREELGSASALMNPVMLDDILTRFKDALEGTHRIRAVARGLGTFSRVEKDQLVPVNLMHVLDVAINMAFNEIKFRARLVKDYGSNLPTVMASEGRLSQVFLNLIINATHAIDEGDLEKHEIRVRTWAEGDQVCAQVRDTGCGIAPENLGKLFDPFFTTKKIGVGSGLGLAISKDIVESYGGTIEVESTVGRGTCFTIRLPVRAGAAATVVASAKADLEPVARGRILIVDDEDGIRAAMVRMLRGHDAVQAASGAQAKEILEGDQAFDLILCDMMMSDVSGMDLHQWLTEKHPRLAKQLIFITGGAFTPRARDYLNKVDNIRLEKPFDVANFKKIVGDRIQMSKGTKPV